MKVFVPPPREDWIVDRMISEWYQFNSDMSTQDIDSADVVWFLAGWAWKHHVSCLNPRQKVVVTVHHVVPEKFDQIDFRAREMYCDVVTYLTYSEGTAEFIRRFTTRPVKVMPYWANQFIWKRTNDSETLRRKYGLPTHVDLIGSFQRDTEGSDLRTPKLEKGPDLFIDYVKTCSAAKPVHVVLAGWRRQYVMRHLDNLGIPYTYIEKPVQDVVNELYQTLTVYPVTSRCEGGPQALIECGLLGIPVISRDVGIARLVLPPTAVGHDVSTVTPAAPDVDHLKIPGGFDPYRRMLEKL